jgi:hypothetical protein
MVSFALLCFGFASDFLIFCVEIYFRLCACGVGCGLNIDRLTSKSKSMKHLLRFRIVARWSAAKFAEGAQHVGGEQLECDD